MASDISRKIQLFGRLLASFLLKEKIFQGDYAISCRKRNVFAALDYLSLLKLDFLAIGAFSIRKVGTLSRICFGQITFGQRCF